MRSKNKLGTPGKLPHAKDIGDLARRNLHEREDYKSAMSKVLSAIQQGAAEGESRVYVRLEGASETVAVEVGSELLLAGYLVTLDFQGDYPHSAPYYRLKIKW